MYTLLVILIVLTSLLMIGIVLIQESKGGGLASGFASANSVAGAWRAWHQLIPRESNLDTRRRYGSNIYIVRLHCTFCYS